MNEDFDFNEDAIYDDVSRYDSSVIMYFVLEVMFSVFLMVYLVFWLCMAYFQMVYVVLEFVQDLYVFIWYCMDRKLSAKLNIQK